MSITFLDSRKIFFFCIIMKMKIMTESYHKTRHNGKKKLKQKFRSEL